MTAIHECRWIGADASCTAPILMRKFSVIQPEKAVLMITGLGYFEAKINGKPITDALFIPVVSDYASRDMTKFLYPIFGTTTNRVYYYTFDVTAWLQEGENTLTIQLGNGFFRQKERIAEGNLSFGDILRTIYSLEIYSQSGKTVVCSDGSEQWMESEIRYSNLFYGEVIDPAAVNNTLHPVQILPPLDTILSPAIGTPDKVIRSIAPKFIQIKNGKALYDAGENISGVAQITTSAPAGEKIVLQFSERIDAEMALDFESAGGLYVSPGGKKQIQEDVFISNGSQRAYRPKFVWHGFRYFTVEGKIDSVTIQVIHSDTPMTARFESDHEGMNFLLDAYVRTQLDNMHGSFPSDCPHRERLGYTGDGQIAAPAAMMLLDSQKFYRKWIQDILDCQDPETGHCRHTAPFMGGGGGPGGWGSAVIMVPYAYYRQYGDTTVLRNCYCGMKKWVGYMESRCENDLLVREEEGGWCLGDWCTLEPVQLPESFVNTCYMIKDLRILEEIAVLLGEQQDIVYYESIRQRAEKAVMEHYCRNGSFFDGIQGADAFGIWCGLLDGSCAGRVAERYEALGHFDTGFLGTDVLLEVLYTYGYGKVAGRLLSGEEPGSYLYMKRRGATTVWESWRGEGSWNHPMFGASARHLFTGVLGIRQRPGTAGYQDIIVRPSMPENANYVSGTLQTVNGEIAVTLQRTPAGVKVSVEAPGMKVEVKGE